MVRSVKYRFSFSALVKSNQYLTDPYRYIIAFYCLHNVFWLAFIIKVFIIKVTVKENSFAWNLQRDELLCNVKSLDNLHFKSYAIYQKLQLIREIKWVKLLHLLILFCIGSLLGGTTRIYFNILLICSLFLIYINQIIRYPLSNS